jgi:hypothetical protein
MAMDVADWIMAEQELRGALVAQLAASAGRDGHGDHPETAQNRDGPEEHGEAAFFNGQVARIGVARELSGRSLMRVLS